LALPEKWNDADPHLIDKGKVEQVRLRSFSTNVHKMEVSFERLLSDGTKTRKLTIGLGASP
jgi:hypothetical protein